MSKICSYCKTMIGAKRVHECKAIREIAALQATIDRLQHELGEAVEFGRREEVRTTEVADMFGRTEADRHKLEKARG